MNITQNQIIAVIVLALFLFGLYMWNCKSYEPFDAHFGSVSPDMLNQLGDFGNYSKVEDDINSMRYQLEHDKSFLKDFPLPYNVHSDQSSQVGASETVEEYGASLKDVLERELDLMNASIPPQTLSEIRNGIIPEDVIKVSNSMQPYIMQADQKILEKIPSDQEIMNSQYRFVNKQQELDMNIPQEIMQREESIAARGASSLSSSGSGISQNNTLLYIGLGLLVLWIIYNYVIKQ